MKISLLILLVFFLALSGCIALDKYVAPCQRDLDGNCIVGTHEVRPEIKNVTGQIPEPYGTILYGLLLAGVTGWNFFERNRANKSQAKADVQETRADTAEVALQSTVAVIEKAGDEASSDPTKEKVILELKEDLAAVHKATNTTKIVDEMIARV